MILAQLRDGGSRPRGTGAFRIITGPGWGVPSRDHTESRGPTMDHAVRRVGAGAASADPYLLRSLSEADTRHLVAASRAESRRRLCVVRGGCPRPHPA